MDSRGFEFNPHRYSDAPVYNIQAVASATGVPSITLRSWERRYGIPEPKRDAKGYRLYSDRDIAIAGWLRERVQQGVGISRAIAMYRLIEQETLAPISPPTLDFDSMQSRLVAAVRDLDEDGMNKVLSESLMVATVEDVALDLLQPALIEVGRLWAEGELSVTREHVASNLIRTYLAQLVRIAPAPLRQTRIMVGAAPGETHDIGALMLTLFLRRRGLRVLYLGANPERESLVADVRHAQPAALCLSVSTVETANSLRSLFDELVGSYSGILAFGGRAFNEHPELSGGIRGINLGSNARQATEKLELMLSEQVRAIA